MATKDTGPKRSNPPKRSPVIDPRAAERRRSILLRLVAVLVVVVVAAGIGSWLVLTHDAKNNSASASITKGEQKVPTVATGFGYRVSGTDTSGAKLTIYEDFQCPACQAFETSFSGAMATIRSLPNTAVEYRMLNFLDKNLGQNNNNYSTRAANLGACVAQDTATSGDWSTWLRFHSAMYAQQPSEESSGLTNEQIIKIAEDAGAPNSVASCANQSTYVDWVQAGNDDAAKTVSATPTLILNDKKLDLSTPDALVAAVKAAAAQ